LTRPVSIHCSTPWAIVMDDYGCLFSSTCRCRRTTSWPAMGGAST
jgi:hypothetical protein